MKNKLLQFKMGLIQYYKLEEMLLTLSIYFSNPNLQRMVLKDWIYFAWYFVLFRIQSLEKSSLLSPNPTFIISRIFANP